MLNTLRPLLYFTEIKMAKQSETTKSIVKHLAIAAAETKAAINRIEKAITSREKKGEFALDGQIKNQETLAGQLQEQVKAFKSLPRKFRINTQTERSIGLIPVYNVFRPKY